MKSDRQYSHKTALSLQFLGFAGVCCSKLLESLHGQIEQARIQLPRGRMSLTYHFSISIMNLILQVVKKTECRCQFDGQFRSNKSLCVHRWKQNLSQSMLISLKNYHHPPALVKTTRRNKRQRPIVTHF